MQMKKIFSKLINGFENTFMKNHSCICCYREIPDETNFMLCENCKNSLEEIGDNICKKCGDKLNKNGKCINDCDKYNYAFNSNFSIYYYTDSAAKIIKNLKYGKRKYLASYVADILLEKFDSFSDIDVILYVPSSKNRIKERGFNQAKVVAEILGEKTEIRVVDGLIKTKDTIHQAGGSQKDRLKNLKDSFAFDDSYVDDIKGKKVLIFDDVFTTGSTLNECAKVVKKLKPKLVKTLTFAKTKFNVTAT